MIKEKIADFFDKLMLKINWISARLPFRARFPSCRRAAISAA
jgi:hypothetical protein